MCWFSIKLRHHSKLCYSLCAYILIHRIHHKNSPMLGFWITQNSGQELGKARRMKWAFMEEVIADYWEKQSVLQYFAVCCPWVPLVSILINILGCIVKVLLGQKCILYYTHNFIPLASLEEFWHTVWISATHNWGWDILWLTGLWNFTQRNLLKIITNLSAEIVAICYFIAWALKLCTVSCIVKNEQVITSM